MEEEVKQDDLTPVEDQASQPEEVQEEVQENEELLKAKEIAENQRIRAEKAEKELKALKLKEPKKESQDSMELRDIRALQDVPDEDVDEVIGYAKYKGISIADAKKDAIIQTLLKTRKEERASAIVASTGNTKKGTSKASEEILRKKTENMEDMTEEEMREEQRMYLKSLGAK